MSILEKNKKILQEAKNFFGEKISYKAEEPVEKSIINEEFINPEQILMMCNNIYIDDILVYENRNRISVNYTKNMFPFYVYYEENVFYYVVEHYDLQKLLQNERVILIVGKVNLENYFQDYNVLYPNKLIGHKCNEVEANLKTIYRKRQYKLEEMKKESEVYYFENEKQIKERIREKDFSILFIIYDDFTYERIQKFYREFSKKIDAIIAFEESCIKRICSEYLINLYKPDVLFVSNRYRTDFPGVFPKRLILLTYIEDPRVPQYLPGFYNCFEKNDLVINIFTKFERLKSTLLGKERWREIPAISINAYSEHKDWGEITDEEHKKYDCDVCFVCSQVDFCPLTSVLLQNCSVNEELQKELENFIFNLYEMQYLDKSTIIGKQQLETAVYNLLEKYNLPQEIKIYIYWNIYNIKYLIDRYVMLQWIIQEKKYRLNIWGFGASEVEAFKPYAKGTWKDEREKYLAISCSKVIVQNEANSGLISPKFTEIIENDSMMLAEYTDPIMEISEYNKYYQEGIGVSLYRSKKELIEKLDYYISHEKERNDVIKRGKKLLNQKLNYPVVVNEWIDAISKKF